LAEKSVVYCGVSTPAHRRLFQETGKLVVFPAKNLAKAQTW